MLTLENTVFFIVILEKYSFLSSFIKVVIKHFFAVEGK